MDMQLLRLLQKVILSDPALPGSEVSMHFLDTLVAAQGIDHSQHLQRHRSLIVKRIHSGGVLGGCIEQDLYQFVGALPAIFRDDLLDPRPPKQLACCIGSINESIAEKQEHISWLRLKPQRLVLG